MALLEPRTLGGNRGSIKRVPRARLPKQSERAYRKRFWLAETVISAGGFTGAQFRFEPGQLGYTRYVEHFTLQDSNNAANPFVFLVMTVTPTRGASSTDAIWIETIPLVVGEPTAYSVNFSRPLEWEDSQGLTVGLLPVNAGNRVTISLMVREVPTNA